MDALSVLSRLVADFGIRVEVQTLPRDTPMRFDGPTITIREAHDPKELVYYLAHSLGSIAEWSRHYDRVKTMFDELRAAKSRRTEDPERLDRALIGFRAFEEAAASYGAWALSEIGQATWIDDYSEFFRADVQAMLTFHRTDRLPNWRRFLAQWHHDLATGVRRPHPFPALAIPRFQPRLIDVQDVKQGTETPA